MKSYEMVEQLSDKTKVSLAQAKEALEKCNWDMLDAAIYIEQYKSRTASRSAPPQTHDTMPDGGFVSGVQNPHNTSFGQDIPYQGYTHYSGAPQGNNYNNGAGFVPPFNQGYNQPPVSFGEMLGRLFGKLEIFLGRIFSDSLVVTKNNRQILRIPKLLFLIALFACFIPTIAVLIIGLASDCKYTFENNSQRPPRTFDDFVQNNMGDALNNTYENVKSDFKRGMDSTRK